MAGPYPVTGDQYYAIDGKLVDIKRQLRAKAGCPIDPHWLNQALQSVSEGRAVNAPGHKDETNTVEDMPFYAIPRRGPDALPGFSYSSNAAQNLRMHDITTIKHLTYYTKQELRALEGIGDTTIKYAEKWCHSAGFELGEMSHLVERSSQGRPMPVVLDQAQGDVKLRRVDPSQLIFILDLGGNLYQIYNMDESGCLERYKSDHFGAYVNMGREADLAEAITEFFSEYDIVWPRPSNQSSI